MPKKLRAALVGCGRIASLFAEDKKRKGIVTHAQAYQARKDIDLVAACDLQPDRLAAFAKAWNLKTTYLDFDAMLKNENLDMVTICTPPSSHFELARKAILKGIPAVFCEKPIASTVEEAAELVRLAKKKSTLFAINHSRRWDRMEQEISSFIRSGKLGKIQTIDAYYTAGIANSGSHLIDLLRMITGDEVVSIQAFDNGLTQAADPSPDVCLKMSSGYQCFLHGLKTDHFLMFEIDIYGSLGRLRIKDSGFSALLWKATPHQKFSGYHQLSQVKSQFGNGYENVLENAVNNIVQSLKGRETLASTGEDGQAALEIIAGVHASLKANGSTISLRHPFKKQVRKR